MKSWIDAGYRKPQDGRLVLCANGDRIWIGYYAKKARYDDGESEHGWFDEHGAHYCLKPIYWHMIPKLPKV